MEVSVVMPTFNRKDSLLVVLKSLGNQSISSERYELILVDNGSTDGTDALISELALPNLKYIVQGDSGRAGARNRGIKEASADLILFTDADIIASPSLIEKHLDFYSKHPNTASVGREIQVNTLEEYEEVKANSAKERTMHRQSKKELKWYNFLTGNALAPKKILEKAGMFDENFTGYGHEDIELGYRIKKMGVPILYNHDAVNYHWHPVEFEEQCRKMHMAGISTVRFYNKYKDFSIKMAMGATPISMLFYNSFSKDGSVVKYCRSRKDESNLCKDIVLQRHYVEGIKEGIKKLG